MDRTILFYKVISKYNFKRWALIINENKMRQKLKEAILLAKRSSEKLNIIKYKTRPTHRPNEL